MSDQGGGSQAATGFTRGFFGCFGMLAAVALLVVVLVVWVGWSGGRNDKAIMAGTADFSGANNPCITAWVKVRHEYPGFEGVDPEASTPAIVLPGPAYKCELLAGDRLKRVWFRLACPQLLDPSCMVITAADAGRPAHRRRR